MSDQVQTTHDVTHYLVDYRFEALSLVLQLSSFLFCFEGRSDHTWIKGGSWGRH